MPDVLKEYLAFFYIMKLKLIAVILFMGLFSVCIYQSKKINSLDSKLAYALNNSRYYESLAINDAREKNRVLQLTVDQLNNSKDSMLLAIKKAQKELKIKDQNLKQAQVINTEMKDTAQVRIITKDRDFTQKLELNSLTTITVSRKDSILTTILDLRNQQIIFVEEKKEYRNKYKNGWQRFWHFDYKKDKSKRYQIKNSNDLIKVIDTRVIEVSN